MAYYIFIQNNKLNGCGECKLLNADVYNADVPLELYEDYQLDSLKYVVGRKEIKIDVPDYETVIEEYIDEDGNTQTHEVQKPIYIETTETIIDEEGNEQTVINRVPSTHKETITVPYPVINPDYESDKAAKREAEFNKAFFNTSLGYVRRSVTMADGSKKDFLSDLLPVISMGVQAGQTVNILTYDIPTFDKDVTDWTEYQHQRVVTAQFIQECFIQLSNDFLPSKE